MYSRRRIVFQMHMVGGTFKNLKYGISMGGGGGPKKSFMGGVLSWKAQNQYNVLDGSIQSLSLQDRSD